MKPFCLMMFAAASLLLVKPGFCTGIDKTIGRPGISGVKKVADLSMFKCTQSKSQWLVSTSFPTLCALALFTLIYTQTAFAQEARSNAQNQARSIARIHKHVVSGSVYFLSFTISTFVPVTKDTIKTNTSKAILLDSYDLTTLYRIISGTPGAGTFDANRFYQVIGKKKKQTALKIVTSDCVWRTARNHLFS